MRRGWLTNAASAVVALAAGCEREFENLWAEETPSEQLWGREDDACHRCLHQSCGGESAACLSDDGCSAQARCLDGCADASCAARCTADGEAPPLTCWRDACFDACWVDRSWVTPAGELLGSGVPAGCAGCFDRECGGAGLDCTSADCVDELGCYESCSDPPCVHRCLDRGEGDGALACLRGKCFEACDIGERFACVRDYEDPRDVSGAVQLDVTFLDFFDLVPPGELTVQLCSEPAVDCVPTLPAKMVDENGKVSFTLNPTTQAGVGVQAFLRVEGPGVQTSRYYTPFPFSGDRKMLLSTTTALAGAAIYEILMVEPAPDRGVIIALLRDCHDDAAPNLRLNVVEGDAQTVVVYQREAQLDRAFTETDSNGRVLIANVPTGRVTLQAFANDGKDLVIERKVGVEAGVITWVSATPIQAQ